MRSPRSTTTLCAVVASVLILTSPVLAVSVVFSDDFDGDTLDAAKWSYQERNWPIGQTWFNGPPTVSGGIATFTHHTYNPGDPGSSCLGQEIYSNNAFALGPGLQLEARVRVRSPVASGLVASFFGYMDKPMSTGLPMWSDEIDIEFLSNQINNPPETGGHRVVVASWNDFGAPGSTWNDGVYHADANPVVPDLDLTEFNVFKVRWLSDSVEWYWDPDTVQGQDLYPDVLIHKMSSVVPDEALTLRFNFWASTDGWPLAWDSTMQPTADPYGDIICYYDVDYVTVTRIPAPASLALVLLGLIPLGSLKIRRRYRATDSYTRPRP